MINREEPYQGRFLNISLRLGYIEKPRFDTSRRLAVPEHWRGHLQPANINHSMIAAPSRFTQYKTHHGSFDKLANSSTEKTNKSQETIEYGSFGR